MAVTDLTNTKWLINSVTCTAGYGQFSVNNLHNDNVEGDLTLGVGYSFDFKSGWTPNANNVMSGETYAMQYTVGDTITITGGTDATNSNLITWLEANATQVITNVDIVFGSNTLTGVDTIKVVDANNTSAYVDFVYGTTPSTTTSIKIGDSTLTGVNTISVLGTDSNQKTFGYKPSAFSVDVTLNNSGDLSYGMVYIYDGQDNTGTLLYQSGQGISSTITTNVQCSTGYLTIQGTANGDPQDSITLNTSASNNVEVISESEGSGYIGIYQITGNATLVANCYYSN